MKRIHVTKSIETSPSQARLGQGGISTGYINIPLDLIMEILKKLPAKSLVRFQCVSKVWSSIISRSRDFIESIMARSPRDAHLIYTPVLGQEAECVFSSEKELLLVPGGMHQTVRGLICSWSNLHNRVAIYNPTTRQTFHLPQTNISMGFCFFGYDPLENQYKVLFLPFFNIEPGCQVYTLGDPTCKQWRTIQGVGYHRPLQDVICVNGAIYYSYQPKTKIYEYESKWTENLMRFDVRSEELCDVETPSALSGFFTSLINYQGKLGFVGCREGMEIWVREDGDQKTQRWSKIFFYEMEGFKIWLVSGVTRSGEIVFVNRYNDYEDMLCVYYYDPKRNSMRFVNLKTIYPEKARTHNSIRTLPDHVENTMCLY